MVKKKDLTPDPLATLAAEIEKCHRGTVGAVVSAIEGALKCGELLNAAKGMVKHGEWESWVENNTSFGHKAGAEVHPPLCS